MYGMDLEKAYVIDAYMNDELIALVSKDLCSYYQTDYFDNKEECINKYSYIINYDYNTFSIDFVQNIRYIKHIAKKIIETENIIGNLTNEKNDIEELLKESDKEYIPRIDLFNNNVLHSDLNIMYINIIIPYFDEIRNVMFKNITFDGRNSIFIILFCIYIPLIALIYFAYLFPMIRYLDNFIYKTKKILLIIPIKILTTQINIKSLLKIT